MAAIKGRITAKKFVAWVNEQFIENGITTHRAVSVHATRFRQDEYEAGAAKLIVSFIYIPAKENDFMRTQYFCCFYSLKSYEKEIKEGYEMYLKVPDRGLYSDMSVEVRKSILKEETINK